PLRRADRASRRARLAVPSEVQLPLVVDDWLALGGVAVDGSWCVRSLRHAATRRAFCRRKSAEKSPHPSACRWYRSCSGHQMRRPLTLSLAHPALVIALTAAFAVVGTIASGTCPSRRFPSSPIPRYR